MDRSKWENKKLKDVCVSIDDGDWIESQDQSSEGIRLIQTGNIGIGEYLDKSDKAKYISEDTFERLKCKEIFSGDCLISRLPDPIGRACILPDMSDRMITAVDCSIVRFKDIIVPDFFVHYTKSRNYNSDINKHATGATRKRISRKNLEGVMIPAPPVADQQRIVAELDCLNEMIALKQEQLKEFDKLAQSIFYDMFGDPLTNEKGWKAGKMGEFCTITSSKRIFANEYCEEGVPFYRGKEITELSKGLPISVELNISSSRYDEIKRDYGIPSIGDILITAVGTIGNIWVVNNNSPFYFKDGNIVWVKDIKDFDPVFFRTILTIQISAYKHEMAQGCAYNALTIVNLKKMKVLLPPLALQQQFAEKIQAIEAQKELVKKSIAETQQLLDSRMDYYFD